jgi:hypothetical protein
MQFDTAIFMDKDFEERMFHYFCGIYFRHRKLVFPIAMFTDPAKWRKPVRDKFSLSLGQYPINEFTYRLIKLKDYKAEELEKKTGENPLAAAYLPLTDYPKKERPVIKARAMKGISGIPERRRLATLYSLIQECIVLNSEEERQFQELILSNPIYKEVKMLQSVREVGVGKGRFQALEETAMKMLSSGVLTEEQIAQFTGLEISKIRKMSNVLMSERQSH